MTKYSLVCSKCSDKALPPVKDGDPCDCGGQYEEAIIRLRRTVTSDYYPTMAEGEVAYALAGEHKAYMNALGAVSVKAQDGEFLGIRPPEMEWVQGMPDGWCGMDKFC